MGDYYTHDVTQLPFRMILRGGSGGNWPFLLRLIVTARKALGWHFPATEGLAFRAEAPSLEVEELPLCLQAEFRDRLREAEELGFQRIRLAKGYRIGFSVNYGCTLCSHDRTTILTVTAARSAVGAVTGALRALGLRTDLLDGTVLLTGRGKEGLERLLEPRYRTEMLAESASIANLVHHHRQRLQGVPHDQVATLPADDLPGFLARRAQTEFHELVAMGLFRKLTDRETARLCQVRFDFE